MTQLPKISKARPTSRPDVRGSGQAQAAIASAFSEMARTARIINEKVIKPRQERKGLREAEQAIADADSEGVPVHSKIRKGRGFDDRSFNNAIRAKSLQNAETAFDERLIEIGEDDPFNPDALKTLGKEFISSYLSEMPADFRPETRTSLERRLDASYIDTSTRRASADLTEAKEDIANGVANDQRYLSELISEHGADAINMPEYMQRREDIEGKIDLMENSPEFGIGAVEAQQMRDDLDTAQERSMATSVKRSEIEGVFRRGGINAALDAVEKFRADGGAGLSQGDRDVIADGLARRANNLERMASGRRAVNFNAAYVDFLDGKAGRADFDKMYQRGQIDASQHRQLVANTFQAQKVSAGERKRQEAITRFKSGQSNPYDTQGQKDMDTVYEETLGSTPHSAEEKFSLIQMFSQNNKYIPKPAASELAFQATSGAPEQRVAALDNISRLLEETPSVANTALPSSILSDAARFSRLMSSEGMTVEDALERVEAYRAAKFDPATEKRQKAADKEFADFDANDAKELLDDKLLGESAFFDIAQGGAAAELYRDIASTEFAKLGDRADAEAEAERVLKATYGTSSVTGKGSMMAFPPERYYDAPEAPKDWIEHQLKDDVFEFMTGRKPELQKNVVEVSTTGLPGAGHSIVQYTDEATGMNISDLTLVPDAQTASEAQRSGNPSYKVTFKNEDGRLMTIAGRFRPDNSEYVDAHARKLQASVEDARKKFSERKERIANRDPRAEEIAEDVLQNVNIGGL